VRCTGRGSSASGAPSLPACAGGPKAVVSVGVAIDGAASTINTVASARSFHPDSVGMGTEPAATACVTETLSRPLLVSFAGSALMNVNVVVDVVDVKDV
jgi:hypothetical protein